MRRHRVSGRKAGTFFSVLHSLTSQEPPVTTSPEASLQQGSSHSPRSPDPKPGNSSIVPCHPEIRQSPAPAGLELLCEADCGPGVAVRWTRAPGHLEAYERRETGARAQLSVPWAGCHPEGWFQCRLDPGGQTASLYLVPEVCEFGWSRCWGGWEGGEPCIKTSDMEVPCPDFPNRPGGFSLTARVQSPGMAMTVNIKDHAGFTAVCKLNVRGYSSLGNRSRVQPLKSLRVFQQPHRKRVKIS